jgi:serine/threonine protein kinase
VICMENMAGGSLAAAIREKTLNPTSKNCTIISLVKGEGYLHANKILHRDLKPAMCFSRRRGGRRSATSASHSRKAATV